MLTVFLIAVAWFFGPLLLLVAISWVYTRIEARTGHDPLDAAFGQRQEHEAELILFPTRGRAVMAAPREAPAELVTPGRVIRRSEASDEHCAE